MSAPERCALFPHRLGPERVYRIPPADLPEVRAVVVGDLLPPASQTELEERRGAPEALTAPEIADRVEALIRIGAGAARTEPAWFAMSVLHVVIGRFKLRGVRW